MKARRFSFIFSLVLLCLSVAVVRSEEAGLAEKCGNEFQKVVVCLDFATGKAAAPSKDCCTSVKSIKDSDPECLCFLIQQAGKGSDKIKSMGIQADKLLQLPSACNLKNASVSDCPKLLGISPSSPDAAMFTSSNASSATPSTAAPATTSSPASKGYATRSGPSAGSIIITAVAALFFTAMPVGWLLPLPIDRA